MRQDACTTQAKAIDLRQLLEAEWADLPKRLLCPVTSPPRGAYEVVAGQGGSQFAKKRMISDPGNDTFQRSQHCRGELVL